MTGCDVFSFALARQNAGLFGGGKFHIVPTVTAMGQFRVRNLAGDLLLEMESESMVHLKQKVSEVCGVPEALLKVVKDNEALGNLLDLEEITVTDEVVELMVLVDDSPCYSWDIAGNPDSEFLKSGASEVVEFVNPDTCLHPDYVNVLSQSPIEKGVHFVEFILHSLGDEQWCGVTFCPSRAGRRGEQAPGVYYYCGRRSSGQGHLDVLRERNHVMPFAHVKSGDAIGLLLDANRGAVLFSLNGVFQGGCKLPLRPVYLSTSLDVYGDCVELRKHPAEDFPVQLEDVIHDTRCFVNGPEDDSIELKKGDFEAVRKGFWTSEDSSE